MRLKLKRFGLLQNCFLADDCPHPGCKGAKLIILHLKTCRSADGGPCPTGRQGCDQAKKLLSHYRRCRKSRLMLAGQHPSRRDLNQQHSCLVCSLVARQARSLERKAAFFPTASSICPVASRPLISADSSKAVKKHSGRRIVASYMINTDNTVMSNPSLPAQPPSGMPPSGMPPSAAAAQTLSGMPPPPPRDSSSIRASITQGVFTEPQLSSSAGLQSAVRGGIDRPGSLSDFYHQETGRGVSQVRLRSKCPDDSDFL